MLIHRRPITVLLITVTAFLGIFYLLTLPVQAVSQITTILRVDKDSTAPTPDGTSWSKAYPNLQDALAAAGTPTAGNTVEIWVAEGVYYPDEGGGQTNNNRAATFQLKNNVPIYGGFAATETARTQRSWTTNITVLSGDIDKNDTTGTNGVVLSWTGINGSNAYHVVNGSAVTNTAALDGFTVTAGQATGSVVSPCSTNCGGGLFIAGGSPLLTGLHFRGNLASTAGGGLFVRGSSYSNMTLLTLTNNRAGKGGGVFNESSGSVTLTEAAFSGNSATIDGGGAFANFTAMSISNSTFSGNTAALSGGGMFSFESAPTLQNVTFVANTASTDGGGMFNDYSNTVLKAVAFVRNIATKSGGGLFNNYSDLKATYLTVSENNAVESGGGMFNFESTLTIVNASLFGNVSNVGGGIFNDRSSPSLTNVIFAGNTTTANGGGVYNFGGSNPLMTNVTLAANHAAGNGGGIFNFDPGGTVRNGILWGNTDSSGSGQTAQISLGVTGTITVSSSLVAGGVYPGSGNITGDPLFVRNPSAGDGSWVTTADNDYGDLRLVGGSPAVNAGNSTLIPADILDLDQDSNTAEPLPVDRAGNIREIGAAVDQGAYERQTISGFIYVDSQATAAGNGASWGTAFKNLQDALFYAGTGAEIWVAKGVYRPGIQRDDTFRLLPSVTIYGGFAATETLSSQRDWLANKTVLSGDIDQNDTSDSNGIVSHPALINGANAYHVVTGVNLTATARLDGFTITAGQADGADAAGRGGGLINTDGSPTLENLAFNGNSAVLEGGGIFNINSSSVLTNISFEGNSAVTGGGGMATVDGVGISLTNLYLAGNTAAQGGGLFNDQSTITMTNVSLAGNAAGTSGGGMFSQDSSAVTVRNGIFWGNLDSGGSGQTAQITRDGSSPITVTYSLVAGGTAYTGTANIIGDPLFVQSPTSGDGNWQTPADNIYGDLRLLKGSPAIDKGLDSVCSAADFRGFIRPVDGDAVSGAVCDMGPFEHTPVTADFTADKLTGASPLTVTFSNLSGGPYETCLWDFGDGNTSSSCANPTHVYTTFGTFTVTLTVSSGESTAVATKASYISITLSADFTADKVSGPAPLAVTFTNNSVGTYTSCTWDFGDGTTSNSCSAPSHTYTTAGLYTVKLTISNASLTSVMTKVDYIDVTVSADFTADKLSGSAPLPVTFTNQAAGAFTTCTWNFGDGTTLNSCANPTHTYNKVGQFTVILTVSDGINTAVETKVNYINVPDFRVYMPIIRR